MVIHWVSTSEKSSPNLNPLDLKPADIRPEPALLPTLALKGGVSPSPSVQDVLCQMRACPPPFIVSKASSHHLYEWKP